jgi:hypothetical protein
MNIYYKFCPNVFLAKTETEYQKDDTIILTTRRGKEVENIVHNLIGKKNGYFYYSITRKDGFDARERAKQKALKIQSWADSAYKISQEYYEKSMEGKEFLSLGEPIKIGHHSEKRHRSLIERNWNRMEKAMNLRQKAESYEQRIAYWESLSDVVNLSMPESLDYYKMLLNDAEAYHKGLKDGSIERMHSYSLTYAKKKVNDLQKKVDLAIKLWR